MATIYDVAKHAGVSPKTVSRVLNHSESVAESTRIKVEASASALGYVRNSAASSMRSKQSGLIGLITGAISLNTMHSSTAAGLPDIFIIQGIQKVIQGSGKTLLIADTGGDRSRIPGLIQTFLEHRVEGMLYVADHHQNVELDIPKEQMNLVLVNCFDQYNTPCVVPDDCEGQCSVVSKLISEGHTRIAYITLSDHMVATQLRKEGYKKALAAANIEFDENLVSPGEQVQSHITESYLEQVLDKLFALPSPPTAICCGNDKMALVLYGVLRTRGIEVPQDVSVVGYDNYREIAESVSPELSTMNLPYFEMGQLAAEQILKLIKGESLGSELKKRVGSRYVWRRSTKLIR